MMAGDSAPSSGLSGIAAASAGIVGAVFATILQVVDRTWRKNDDAKQQIDRLIADGRPIMAVFWHGKYLPLFSTMAGLRGAAFTSFTWRGSIVAQICRRFGYEPYRLPPKGGQRSRAIIRDALKRQPLGGFAVDGPLGPYHSIKPGAIEFASELRGLIVPIGVGIRRRYIMAGRWDRLEIPLPFARLVILIGDPIEVPEGIDDAALAQMKTLVREALEALEARAEILVRQPRQKKLEPILEDMKEDRA